LCERAWDRAKASIGQPGPFEVDAALGEAGVARIRAFHARWHGAAEDRVQTGLAAWAPDMAAPERLGRWRKLQDELGVLASIHLNQVWGEVAAVREQRGVLPTEYLARTGFLSDRLVAARCRRVAVDEEGPLRGAS